MLKYFVPASLAFLFMACGQQGADKTATVSPDTTTTKQPVADDTAGTVPLGAAKADEYSYKEIAGELPPALASFVPKGYIAMDTCSGDLNLDAYRDVLLVMRQNGEDSLSKLSDSTIKRRLLILTAQEDGSYRLAAQSDNAVYCYTCGGMMGDPFMGLVIKNGYFSIEHYGGSAWRWTRTITFKYSPADSTWCLHKDGHESFNVNDEKEKKTTKIYTVKNFGKVPFDKFDVYKDVE